MVDNQQTQQTFSLEKLVQGASSVAKQGENIDATQFSLLLDEVVRLMGLFGSALGFAFNGKLLLLNLSV